MKYMYLTKSKAFLIGWIATLLGFVMNWIFMFLDLIKIPNIGLSIILFTIFVYLCMLPLTIKQQKFSKLQVKMSPELQEIQKKYKNRKDQDSQMQMNAETQAVYAKYGVSPAGSCLQLLIQMPILFALYQVIYKIPAYVTKVGQVFNVLAEKIYAVDAGEFLKNSEIGSITKVVSQYGQGLTKGADADAMTKGIIDILYKLSSGDMATIAEHYDLADLTYNGSLILSNGTTRGLIDHYNIFLGINIGNSPWFTIQSAWADKSYGLLIGALMIPILAGVTQWINTKLMPTQNNNNNDGNDMQNSMAASMKTMNYMMPLMSVFFCFTLPAGLGLYWVAGAVVRTIQQIIINKSIDKMDLNAVIEKNKKKSAKKMAKIQANQEKYQKYASMSTKNLPGASSKPSYMERAAAAAAKAQSSQSSSSGSTEETSTGSTSSTGSAKGKGSSSGTSLFAKANAVREYNERNNRKE